MCLWVSRLCFIVVRVVLAAESSILWIVSKDKGIGVYTFVMSKYLFPILGLLVLLALLLVVVMIGISRSPEGPPELFEAPQAAPSSVQVRHSFDGTSHRYSGSLELPACNTLATSLATSGTDPVKVSLALRAVTNDPSCVDTAPLQQPFELTFSTTQRSTSALTEVTFNGKKIEYTLVEAGANQ